MKTDERPPLFLVLIAPAVYGLVLVIFNWPKDTREWLASASSSVSFWVLFAGLAYFAPPVSRVATLMISVLAGAVAGWVWWFVAAQGNVLVSVGIGVVAAIALAAAEGGLSKNVRAA